MFITLLLHNISILSLTPNTNIHISKLVLGYQTKYYVYMFPGLSPHTHHFFHKLGDFKTLHFQITQNCLLMIRASKKKTSELYKKQISYPHFTTKFLRMLLMCIINKLVKLRKIMNSLYTFISISNFLYINWDDMD